LISPGERLGHRLPLVAVSLARGRRSVEDASKAMRWQVYLKGSTPMRRAAVAG
jgi:hypothetical protein